MFYILLHTDEGDAAAASPAATNTHQSYLPSQIHQYCEHLPGKDRVIAVIKRTKTDCLCLSCPEIHTTDATCPVMVTLNARRI